MNLKDNRENAPENANSVKFNFCIKKGIVGIGWVGYDKNPELCEKDIGYKKARNSIFSFETDDLVWVKNSETQRYYLCKIVSQAQATEENEYNEKDISIFCKCEYIDIGTVEELPYNITKEQLISITTVSKANEQLSEATLKFYNTITPKNKCKLDIFKFKRIYLLYILIITLLLSVILTINGIHNKQEKEIEKSLANKAFINNNYIMLEFKRKGTCDYSEIDINNEKNIITNISEKITDFDDYDVKISFWGEKFIICNGKHSLLTDDNNNVISFGNYYPIKEEFKEMLDDYYLKLKEEKEKKEKEENEIKQAKSFLPNQNEFYERVLKVFPEVKNWQLYGNTDGLYMDPYNSKNYCLLSKSPILIFNNGSQRIAFMVDSDSFLLSANGGATLTNERYNQLIQLAFGDAPDNLKIPDLETFKKLTDTDGKAYPTSHSITHKGITYKWDVGYKNGVCSGFTFMLIY